MQALAGELNHTREAESWLLESTPWLGSSQRQSILDDLKQTIDEQGSAAQQPSLQSISPAVQEDNTSWASPKVARVAHCHSPSLFLCVSMSGLSGRDQKGRLCEALAPQIDADVPHAVTADRHLPDLNVYVLSFDEEQGYCIHRAGSS